MSFTNSHEWRQIKVNKLNTLDGFICQCCNYTSDTNLHFHHIEYPEKLENTTNEQLVILCVHCHKSIHFLRDMTRTLNRELSLNINNPDVKEKVLNLLKYLEIPIFELTEKRLAKARENKISFIAKLQDKLNRKRVIKAKKC